MPAPATRQPVPTAVLDRARQRVAGLACSLLVVPVEPRPVPAVSWRGRIGSVVGSVARVLSVIVNFFNNRREARNTLHSLTRGYQLGAAAIDYEVIAIDNGSTSPLSADEVRSFGPQFHYRFEATRSVSPVGAINRACREAAGEQLLILIDGAHILSPGILRGATQAFSLHPAAFVATVAFHLGPKVQNLSIREGYSQAVEDALLARSRWREDGYELFNLTGSFADDSGGWFGCLFESGCFGLGKRDFLAMGGLDERFQSRGGGLVNLDVFRNAVSRPDLEYVVLLGEGTFHQVHGGVATNAPADAHPWADFHREYVAIRGMDYTRVLRRPVLLGAIPDPALGIAQVSARQGLEFWKGKR